MKRHLFLLTMGFAALASVNSLYGDPAEAAQTTRAVGIQIPHPAIGSWFGEAVQICASAAGCQNVVLFMTPTLTSDYTFVADDTLTLGGPPFGPHTTAHGRWLPTGSSSIVADYVFLLQGSASPLTFIALRARWLATVTDYDTMQGYVNAYLAPNIPAAWTSLAAGQFPAIPNEAAPALTSPINFYTDPAACTNGAACPLLFRFTLKRVQP